MKMIVLVKDLETDWPTGGQLPDFFQTKADKKLIWKLFNLNKWRLSEKFLEREKIAKLKFETWFCVESELIVCSIITQKINEQLQWNFVQYLQQFIYLLYLLKNWPLFVYFRPFLNAMTKIVFFCYKWWAWNSNPGPWVQMNPLSYGGHLELAVRWQTQIAKDAWKTTRGFKQQMIHGQQLETDINKLCVLRRTSLLVNTSWAPLFNLSIGLIFRAWRLTQRWWNKVRRMWIDDLIVVR